MGSSWSLRVAVTAWPNNCLGPKTEPFCGPCAARRRNYWSDVYLTCVVPKQHPRHRWSIRLLRFWLLVLPCHEQRAMFERWGHSLSHCGRSGVRCCERWQIHVGSTYCAQRYDSKCGENRRQKTNVAEHAALLNTGSQAHCWEFAESLLPQQADAP